MAMEPPAELGDLARAFRESDYRIEGDRLDEPGPSHHDHATRTVHYRGHVIEITTHYEVKVDGEPWTENEHLHVLPDGTVHYHALPQYAPASMIDLMKAVVDAAELAGEPLGAGGGYGEPGHDDGGHNHGHDGGGHNHGHDPGGGPGDPHGDHDHGSGRDHGDHDHGGHGG